MTTTRNVRQRRARREAVTAANDDSDASTIGFAAGLNGTIQLAGALPALSTDLTILGPGARKLDVHRSSGGNYSVFSITGGTVAISGLTISGGGNDLNGGGVANSPPDPVT